MKEQPFADGSTLEIADTILTKAVGLMFRKEPVPLLLVFGIQARHSIWMLFMRFPIDLIFLDSQRTVVTI